MSGGSPGLRGAPAWGGRLFMDAGTILFVGPGGRAERHAHHAVQLVLAEDGEFTVEVDEPRRRRAALVPAGVHHSFDATGLRLAILYIEPHGPRGAALDRLAQRDTADDPLQRLLSTVQFPRLDFTLAEASAWCDRMLTALGCELPASALSSVSRRAIAYVEESISGRPLLADAARRVGASPSRLTHVFTTEVGIPFRRFVLWTRMKHVIVATQAGNDLTTAAQAAGFADSAHLSRTFRAMFGLSPSLVLPLAELVGDVVDRGVSRKT